MVEVEDRSILQASKEKPKMERIFKLKLTDPKTSQPWTVVMENEDKNSKHYSLIEPLVKFYDMRYPEFTLDIDGDRIGQFVSSYYASTINDGFGGINLHGGEPSWQVSVEFMTILRGLITGYFIYEKYKGENK